MIVQSPTEWYVQRNGHFLGPFTPGDMARFVLLGRLLPTARVTSDGVTWFDLADVRELVPDAILAPCPWMPPDSLTRPARARRTLAAAIRRVNWPIVLVYLASVATSIGLAALAWWLA